MSPTASDAPPRGRGGEVATVASAFLAYGAVFFDRLAPLYLVGIIASDLDVPPTAEGTLALVIGLGWAAAMPIVRATSGRFADRNRVVVAAVLTAALGMLSATADTWLVFVTLRGLAGLASASGSPAVTAIVFAVAPAHRRGRDVGLVQASTRVLGSLVSPIVVTAITVALGWRAALVGSSLLLLVGGIILALAVPGGGERAAARAAAPAAPFRLHPGGRRNVALCTAASVLLLAWLMVWSQSSVGLIRGWLQVDPDAAGRYAGWFGVGAAVAAVAVPIVSDRIGRRAALGFAGGLGGVAGIAVGLAAVAGLDLPSVVVAGLLTLSGTAMGGLPLVISLVPAEAVASGDVGRVLVAPIAAGEVLGAALLPALASLTAAHLGLDAVVAMTGVAVLGLVGIAAAMRPTTGVRARPR